MCAEMTSFGSEPIENVRSFIHLLQFESLHGCCAANPSSRFASPPQGQIQRQTTIHSYNY